MTTPIPGSPVWTPGSSPAPVPPPWQPPQVPQPIPNPGFYPPAPQGYGPAIGQQPNPGFYPPPTPPVFAPLPPRKSKTGLLVGIVIGAVVLVLLGVAGIVGSSGFAKGFTDGLSSARPSNAATTAAQPAPTVTVTAAAPATKASTNVGALKVAWAGMSSADQDGIRDNWTSARSSTSGKNAFLGAFVTTIRDTLPTITRAEALEFLEWTLDN